MKRFLAILVLGLFLITPSQADDIQDFQIEGMSIGDNLLDHFSKKEIINESVPTSNYNYLKNPDKFIQVEFVYHSSLKTYDTIQVYYKNIPNEYKVYGIVGKLLFEKNIHECVSKRDQIVAELKGVLKNFDIDGPEIQKHPADKAGKSAINQIAFWLKNDDVVIAECYDWSEEMKYYDNLKINILTNEVNEWLMDHK